MWIWPLAYCPGQFRPPVSIPDLEIDALFREKTLINPPVKREPFDPKGRSTPDNLLHTILLFYKVYQASLIGMKLMNIERPTSNVE